MSNSVVEQAVKDIKEADLVLVGIGEDLDMCRQLKKNEKYLKALENFKEEWLFPYVEEVILDGIRQENDDRYRNLAKCLDNKNYFIVSLCQDGIISNAGLKEDRIVEPCGSHRKLQCPDGCGRELYEVPDGLLEKVKTYLSGELPGNIKIDEMPVCPHCGKPLVFNSVGTASYVEEGYLEKWKIYQKWLQGSVNRKLCILELGVGMKYPTVVRWPFEKIVFFNLKSKLYRVHGRLYHITEEIKERSCGVCQKPEEFLKELSNGF